MRLSQRYADHSAELVVIVDYIMGSDSAPTADAIRLGISADEVNSISVYGEVFSCPVAKE